MVGAWGLVVKRTLAVGSAIVLVRDLHAKELLLEMCEHSNLAQDPVQTVELEAVVEWELAWSHYRPAGVA